MESNIVALNSLSNSATLTPGKLDHWFISVNQGYLEVATGLRGSSTEVPATGHPGALPNASTDLPIRIGKASCGHYAGIDLYMNCSM